MPIRFPKVHIAKSVVNQILNVADGIASSTSRSQSPAPNVPDVTAQSAALDNKLAQPIREPMPGLDEAPDPGGTLAGDRLLDTFLKPSA